MGDVHGGMIGGKWKMEKVFRSSQEGDTLGHSLLVRTARSTPLFPFPSLMSKDKGNPRLAGRGERLLAKCIDVLIVLVPVFIVSWMVMASSGESTDTFASVTAFWLVILSVVIVQAYFLSTQGQSLAKKMLHIRILDAETLTAGGFARIFLLRSVLNFILIFIPFYCVVDALYIFRKDRRCVHDFLARTIVVRATANDTVK